MKYFSIYLFAFLLLSCKQNGNIINPNAELRLYFDVNIPRAEIRIYNSKNKSVASASYDSFENRDQTIHISNIEFDSLSIVVNQINNWSSLKTIRTIKKSILYNQTMSVTID